MREEMEKKEFNQSTLRKIDLFVAQALGWSYLLGEEVPLFDPVTHIRSHRTPYSGCPPLTDGNYDAPQEIPNYTGKDFRILLDKLEAEEADQIEGSWKFDRDGYTWEVFLVPRGSTKKFHGKSYQVQVAVCLAYIVMKGIPLPDQL